MTRRGKPRRFRSSFFDTSDAGIFGAHLSFARTICQRRFRQRRTPRGKTTMPLRVELKPFERIVIGESVITNSDTRTCFLIDGETPILREKDTVSAETADTPAKRLYLCVQMMYLKNDPARYREAYLGLLAALREAEPAALEVIAAADSHVTAGSLYKALKDIRKLMKREEELQAA
jgi:flagellar biosynthesis repressor protein FlbT